jgi:predicted DNA-binding transcriptional regulator AlpA
MQASIDPVVDIEELKVILGGVSTATVYRWLAESRKGIGALPLPINTGGAGGGRKRRLLWSRGAILKFINNQK